MQLSKYWVFGLICCFVLATNVQAQVPKPADVFGFKPGADYKLANYEQMLDYYNKLTTASDRVKKITLGKTVDGRPMILLFISSEENLQQLEHWRDISEKLSRARIDSTEARKLSQEGKAIVWIDGGMHARELAHGQMTPELAYRVATEETAEMQRIRNNVVLLLMPVMNPDGMDIVSSWYKKNLGTPYETSETPWLWQRYVGHDNNRDWFMGNMPETKNVLKVLYRQWYPQIVYNHHQTSPAWARIFIPPFSDPVNQHIPPGVTAGVSEVGSAMMRRFAVKHMPGAISNIGFTMFWDGGGRTVPYYHNQIGILTETAQATPTPRYYDPDKKPDHIGDLTTDSTSIFYPYPWQGGESHFRDAVNYMITGSMAVLDYAADRRSNLLYDIYSMGHDAVKSGQKGDPFAYIILKQQWDEWEANNLVNILYRGGIEIKKASNNFTAGGKQFEAGSYVLYAGQSFRPYLMDLLEKQNYPTRFQYPGGPPDPPYDLAGWTLPMQMGVNVERINEPFNVSSNNVTDLVNVEPSAMDGDTGFGFMIKGQSNASVKAVNILLKKGADISRTMENGNVSGREVPVGSFIVSGSDASTIKELGIPLKGLSHKPDIKSVSIKRPKVGIYKSWLANKDEGWTRWLLKEYDFEVDTLHDADITQKDLSQYQSIIIPSQRASSILHGYSIRQMPKQYTGGVGLDGTTALEKFIKSGGTLITFDAASDYAIEQFGLPLKNVVKGLSDNQFYIPGSLIRTFIDTSDPLAYGMQDTVAVAFERSRAFEIQKQSRQGFGGGTVDIKDAPKAPVDVIARYAKTNLLMSGWAMGEDEYIADKPAMVRLPYGEGQIVLFAFRPQFRGQPRGTYKLIFNALYNSTVDD